MKKDFLWMLGVLIAMFFASCGSESGNLQKGPGVTVTAIADTSVLTEHPTTAPRYACGTGKRLKYDKYLGSDIKLVSVSDTESVFLSDDSLNQIGYIYRPGISTPNSEDKDANIFQSSDSPFTLGFFEDLLKFLLVLCLFGCAVWFLWWLFNQRPVRRTLPRGVGNLPAATPAPVVQTPASPASPTQSAQQPANPSHQDIVSHLKDLMKTMQDTGTTELDYSTHGHEVHLKNSGKNVVKEKKVPTEKSASSDQAGEEKK